jgi:transposase-like protein
MSEAQKRDTWAKRMRAWERSGRSRRAWCESNGVNLHTFDYWRRQLRSEPGLLPLVVEPVVEAAPAQVEIVLANGVVLRMPLMVDTERLVHWVRALQSC